MSVLMFNFLACGKNVKEDVQKPNILFILIDDLGYGDIAAHGNPVLKTPNMDLLHAESLRFINFSLSPTCAPTRAAIMSGRHEFNVDVTHTDSGRRNLDVNCYTLASLFKENGYVTGMFGKWHLGDDGPYRPERRGFDEALNIYQDNQNSHFDPTFLRNGVEEQIEGFRTDILFDEAMSFMERNRDKPFFCYLPTYSPHEPLIVPEKYSEAYSQFDEKTSKFFGMVANVDENIGRLMKKLSELKLDENTLVIFMNDNGGTYGVDTYNAGMRGCKAHSWWGGVRGISFWRWPEVIKTGDCGIMSAHLDIFPTLAAITKAYIPEKTKKELEGINLLPYLKNPDTPANEDRMLVHHRGRWKVFSEYPEHKYAQAGVRLNDYQLNRIKLCDNELCQDCRVYEKASKGWRARYSGNTENYYLHEEWALYNVKDDVHQDHDISKEEPEVFKLMVDYYEKWWDGIEVKFEEFSPNHTK
ncbi:arylsulfatase [Bacteroidota bacterium]